MKGGYGKAEKYVAKENLISLIRLITLNINLKAFFHLHIKPILSSTFPWEKNVVKIKKGIECGSS